MAYSLLERPKLNDVKSLRFYPENYDHHVSFRHKGLAQNFDLTIENFDHVQPHKYNKGDERNNSIKPQTSTNRKCPIYVHSFAKIGKATRQMDGDFTKTKHKHKMKHKEYSVIEKLEESYWANWKPDRNKPNIKQSKPVASPKAKQPKSPEVKVVKSAPERRHKIKVFPDMEGIPSPKTLVDNSVKSSKSQEIQTDELSIFTPKKSNKKMETNLNENVEETSNDENLNEESKFLKHTDSFILNSKKQKEEKEHFEQPRCIRLYKKPGKMPSKNYVKGGSYPLKSCLKKESNLSKGNFRLGRPGSPVIVTSNYSSKKSYKH